MMLNHCTLKAIKIKAAAPSADPPITGWYLSQDNPKVIAKSGKLTRKAAKKTIIPEVAFRNPPTKGKYPITSTIGLKKTQIPRTMSAKNAILKILVYVLFFFMDNSIMSLLL